MQKNSKIYIAGNSGLVGSALVRKLKTEGYSNLIFTPYPEYDLRNQQQTNDFFNREKPEYVVIAAGKVGGILANNTYRAEFIYDNLLIASNIVQAAYMSNVHKLIFLGSSCIYPKNCPQPMTEEYLLTGPLEPTNEPYAIAKIAGIKLCENYYRQYGCNFYSVMPTNLYGPNDNFDLETSHVLPALLRKFHEAKIRNLADVMIWGSGKPLREFLYVDDLVDAILFLFLNINSEEIFKQGISHLNIGSSEEISIAQLAELIKKTVGFTGPIHFDASKPDGMLRKLLSSTRINELGWKKTIPMEVGILKYYDWYLTSVNTTASGKPQI